MNDVRDVLERAREHSPDTRLELDRVMRRRDRRIVHRRVAAATLGLALTAVLVGGTALVLTQQREPTVAGDVEPAVDLSLARGEYYYLRTYQVPAMVAADAEGDATRVNGISETWWTLDGSGRISSSLLDGSRSREETFAPGEFPRASELAHETELSTDPEVLEQQLRDAISPSGVSPMPFDDWANDAATPPPPEQGGAITWGLVRVVDDLLMDPSVEPELKAALMQVAANLPGMDVRRDAADPLGRGAVRLSIVTEDRARAWWFDPASGQPLAVRDGEMLLVVQAAGIVDSNVSTELVRSFVRVDDSRLGPDVVISPTANDGDYSYTASGF